MYPKITGTTPPHSQKCTSTLLEFTGFVQYVLEAAQCCHLASPLVVSESHRAEAGSRAASPGTSPGGEEADASPARPRAASGAGRPGNHET